MASLHLCQVLIVTVVACFCQLPLNASQRSPRALVAQISQDPATLLYTVEIQQRTPLRIQRLVVDIEQDYTWVRCDKKRYRSATYSPVACSAPLCKSYQYSGCGDCYAARAPGCNNHTCTVPGKGTSSFELGQDAAALLSSDGSSSGPLARFPRLPFACATQEVLSDLRTGTAGVAGMSSSILALPSQLSAAAGFSRIFAFCPSGAGTGFLFFGDGPLSYRLGFEYFPPYSDLYSSFRRTPLIKNPVYTDAFYIGVQGITVDNVRVPIDVEKFRIDANGRGGTRLSTVVPYTQLATTIYNSFVGVFTNLLRQMNISRVASVPPFGACFDSSAPVSQSNGPNGYDTRGAGSTDVGPSVPTIRLMVQGNLTSWDIFGVNSVVYVSFTTFCLGFVDGGEDAVASIVIGTFQMEDNFLRFDLTTSTLALSSTLLFERTSCNNFNFSTSL